MKRFTLVLILFLLPGLLKAQLDTLSSPVSCPMLGASAVLMATGTSFHYVPALREQTESFQQTVADWRGDRPKCTVDNFLQLSHPVAMVALKACGVPSRHNWYDMVSTSVVGYATMLVVVNTGKYSFGMLRPDGSAHNSFPSGHTATAFTGAELMRIEYWETSPWIGVAGYVVATATGFLRIYNNRHWCADVMAGAGVGILSAQFANWITPKINGWLAPKQPSFSLNSPLKYEL